MISSPLLQIIKNWQSERIVRIVVARVEGSAPREPGASMWVSDQEFEGTIGGGRLEYEALNHARELLANSSELSDWYIEGRNWPLGPELGQCCGGMVAVLFELVSVPELEKLQEQIQQADQMSLVVQSAHEPGPPLLIHDRHDLQDIPLDAARVVTEILRGGRQRKPELVGDFTKDTWFVEPLKGPKKPLYIYGAGHVGRAIVKSIEGLGFAITWVETHEQRFPDGISSEIDAVVAKNPQDIANKSPSGAYHLIMTYSHEIDFELCRTLLVTNRFGYLGLIGSKTKRVRFMKRLEEQSISSKTLLQLTCPIGIEHIKGKQPASIAVSVAAQLLQKLEAEQCSQIVRERSTYVRAK